MRLVMMGTGGFAVPTFAAMLASSHEVLALVTRPTRRGRGGRPPQNPMREAGQRAGIRMLDPPSINDPASLELVRQMEADLMVVCDYGQILSPRALGTTRLGGINLHASLLPAYRGAAPINWTIYDGKEETGVSVIHMTPRLDAGPILLQKRTPIGGLETAVELELRLAQIGAAATLEAIEMLDSWDGTSAIGKMQADKQATKAPRLKKEDGLVDFSRSAKQIANQVRAFKPWPRTYTLFQHVGKWRRLIIEEALALANDNGDHPPGTIFPASDGACLVATGDGQLQLDVVQPEGKKRLSGSDFLRGYRVVGSQLGS